MSLERSEREPSLIASTFGTNRSIARTRPSLRSSPRALDSNKMYTAVPSASTPNHLFSQSATSCGIHDNIMYSSCGGKTDTFPQMTVYDSLYVNGVSFSLFMNSTCGVDGKPCHGVDPHTPEAGSPIPSPDVAMSGVARHKSRFISQKVFYEQAANGTLPAFSWVMPPMEACGASLSNLCM